jgi:hypothetical protein
VTSLFSLIQKYVFFFHGLTARLIALRCTHARTKLNAASPWACYGNFTKMDRTEIYSRDSLYNGSIVYVGGEVAFERSFTEAYAADLISHSHSWCKTTDSMNPRAFNLDIVQENLVTRRTVADAMLKSNLVEFDLSSINKTVRIPSGMFNFTDWAWSQYPRLLSAFIYLWPNHQTLIRPCHAKCSAAIVVDEHQKSRRRVCREKSCSITTEEFSIPVMVGCCGTPAYNSHYCTIREQRTRSNPALVSVKKSNLRTKRLK